jgi:hypothetical protein
MNSQSFLQSSLRKITSRKFLAAATLVIAGLIAMFRDIDPNVAQGQVAGYMAYVPNVVGALTAVLGALGFMKAEAEVDAAREAHAGEAGK